MKPHTRTRIYQMIPGLLLWVTLVFSITFAIVRPIWAIYFIILFDVYWLVRVVYYLPFILIAWRRYRDAIRRDWQKDAVSAPGYERIRHLIFLPTYKEEIGVIRDTLNHLLKSKYPPERMIICLAGEERDAERFNAVSEKLKREYGSKFLKFVSTVHPANLPDEIPGKGSNLNFAGQQMIPVIESLGISPDDLIVSSFDIDTQAHVMYFSCLTYTYLTTEHPTRSSYQPMALYNNNLWEAKAPVRVAMFGTTFWLMSELTRPEGALTFSSHSMSWRMLLDVGFWQKDIVSEDSRIFLQALVWYDGDYRVTPIYLPVSMDSVDAVGYVPSLGALYKQIRRWAWGVENFSFMMNAFRSNKKIPRRIKRDFILKQLEGSYTWATAPIIITLLGQLPFWFASDEFRSAALFQNTPFTLQFLMQLALVGVFVSAALALTLLPQRPAHIPRHRALVVILLQWLLLPITFVVFGSFPAVDALTRHMLGGRFRLGFNVSAKHRSV